MGVGCGVGGFAKNDSSLCGKIASMAGFIRAIVLTQEFTTYIVSVVLAMRSSPQCPSKDWKNA